MSTIRWVRANNPSSMTLDGTRTYIVGDKQVAIIDPGPLLDEHLDAVADTVGSGASVSVLLTHGHPDHADAASSLARRLHTMVMTLGDGGTISTDVGPLHALATPGHTPDHFSYWHEPTRSVFCGDLMMGGLDTALVAPPEGDLRDYLQSLERIRALQPDTIYPAHGDAITDVSAALDRYVAHRMDRVQQVARALESGPQTSRELVATIYGKQLDKTLRAYAANAVKAYLLYLEQEGRVKLIEGAWKLV